eukprot:Clim_evm34s25 gene=Clim_evmTU34s25
MASPTRRSVPSHLLSPTRSLEISSINDCVLHDTSEIPESPTRKSDPLQRVLQSRSSGLTTIHDSLPHLDHAEGGESVSQNNLSRRGSSRRMSRARSPVSRSFRSESGGAKDKFSLTLALKYSAAFALAAVAYEFWDDIDIVGSLHAVQAMGFKGKLLLMFVYIIIGQPFAVGYTQMQLIMGFLYGWWEGLFLNVFAAHLSTACVYWVFSPFFKNYVDSIIEHRPYLQMLRTALHDDAFRVVCVARMCPIPFGIQNTLYAVSGVPYPQYALGSLLGLFPNQVIFTLVGTEMESIAEMIAGEKPIDSRAYVMFAIQTAAVVTILLLVRKQVSKMNQMVFEASQKDEQGGTKGGHDVGHEESPDCSRYQQQGLQVPLIKTNGIAINGHHHHHPPHSNGLSSHAKVE